MIQLIREDLQDRNARSSFLRSQLTSAVKTRGKAPILKTEGHLHVGRCYGLRQQGLVDYSRLSEHLEYLALNILLWK